MSDPSEVHVTGHCFCGGVTFTVDIPAGDRPIFTAYCHCDDCRRSHATPLYQVVCVDEGQLSITAGADLLRDFTRDGGRINRQFCGTCGTRVLNRFPSGWRPGGRTPVVFFPNLLSAGTMAQLPEPLRPIRQNFGEQCVLDKESLQRLFASQT